ncbi:MAG: phosphoadenosine phosphosulfate reductase family protein [Ignavibacteriota bacterium]
MSTRTLTHLQALEAESIHILREVAAEFQRPVMLYSIGKDSSVMVRLAQKHSIQDRFRSRFSTSIPVTNFVRWWNFAIVFARRSGAPHRSHQPASARRGRQSIPPGHAKVLWTSENPALCSTLSRGGYDAAFGGARRDEEKSRAKERVYSFRDSFGQWDPKNQRPNCGTSSTAGWIGRVDPRLPAFQLDRARCLGVHPT